MRPMDFMPGQACELWSSADCGYRKTETGEGPLSSMETIRVFIAIPITDPGGGRTWREM